VTAILTAKTPTPATTVGRRISKRLRSWPVGLSLAAVVYFFYAYLDTYFQNLIPSGLHSFTNTFLPVVKVNETIVYAMAAIGLNIVVGYAGLLDLGFVAFWAIGGYTMGWLASDFFYGQHVSFFGSAFSQGKPGVHLNIWTVIVAGAILAFIGGVLIGAPTLRLKSDYLALVTLGFGEIIGEVAFNGDNIFGHDVTHGNRSISPTDYPQFITFDKTGAIGWGDVNQLAVLSKYILFVLLAALLIFASLRIREGRLGRAWLAIREDELAASTMGVPLMRTKLAAYGLGAIAGGVAGVAFAVHNTGVFPDQLKFNISINLLAMVVLGGMGNVWGVTIGALLLAWTNNSLLPWSQTTIEQNEAAGSTIGYVMLAIGLALAAAFAVLFWRRRRGLLALFVAAPALVIAVILLSGAKSVSFQFLIFGAVLIIMMLFRREGLIPEARTRLILREPGRTEAESRGADLEDEAPELEALRDEAVHAHGTVPLIDDSDGNRT
jgi:branched-chain amino acid transport system permease protein